MKNIINSHSYFITNEKLWWLDVEGEHLGLSHSEISLNAFIQINLPQWYVPVYFLIMMRSKGLRHKADSRSLT